MLVRNLVRKFRPVSHLRSFSSSEAQIFNETASVGVKNTIIPNNLNIEEYRNKQLERLQSLKPSDFTPSALNQLISDFLISPLRPDVQVAGKLLDKFLFNVPGVDDNGELCVLYLLQLIDAEDIEMAADFFMKLLKSNEEAVKSRTLSNSFMFECLWKEIIDKKFDSVGFNLLKACCLEATQPAISELVTSEFKEKLILELFLPRLNWPAIDFVISASVSNHQITVPAAVLQEIFHVLLSPVANDYHYDPVESEPFTSHLVNPRFHRLIEGLNRWKNAGIPIKGTQIAKALEESFKKFLPTEPMMESLQKLL